MAGVAFAVFALYPYMKTELDQYLRRFLEHLEIEKNRSPLTLRNYSFYLGRFIEWLGRQGIKEPGKITSEHVRQYRLWLNRLTDASGELLKRNTQNYHLIAVRAWFKYLAKNDVEVLAPEKIELARQPDRHVEFLETDELERLLAAPLENPKRKIQSAKHPSRVPGASYQAPVTALRDKAILELLFSTGLRVSELAKLKIDDVNLERDDFSVRGKGSKIRVVFLSDAARKWLGEYRKKRHDQSEYLFVGHHKKKKSEKEDKPLTPRSIQRIVEHYARAAGITKAITPHTLRHTFATDLLRNGADLRSVQSLLGHSSITTTQVYTHITDEHLKDVHKAFHGKRRSD